jgi:Tfp pilus assembly protein PilV
MRSWLDRRRAGARPAGEGGFTIVELMVAVGVMFAGLTALAYTATVAFSDIGTARQRQAAHGLLNQTMEQVRALPFDTLAAGVDNADAAADTANITVSGSTYTYKGNNETMPHGVLPAQVTPLFPHVRSGIKVGPTTYTVAVYPTYLAGSNQTAFRVTTVVTWPKLVRGSGPGRVEGQTIVYSPEGCLSTATHPFSAPCQPFSYAAAAVQPGGATLTGTIQGINLVKATTHLGESTSNMQLEQVTAMQGYARTPGFTLSVLGVADQTSGLSQVTTRATSGTGQPGSDYDAKTVTTPGTPTVLSVLGSQNLLELFPDVGGDTASSVSTISSTATNACADPQSSNQLDSQPCGNGVTRQSGDLTMQLSLSTGSAQIGSGPAQLITIRRAVRDSASYTNRDAAPGTTACPATSGDGCVHAEAQRSIGRVRVTGLPVGMEPVSGASAWALGCRCLLELSNYADAVEAEAGGGSDPPAVTVTGADPSESPTPVLKYWNGTGYTSVTEFTGAPQTFSVPSVTAVEGSTTITIGANLVRTGGTSTSSTTGSAGTACPATCHTSGDARANSPLIADITYSVVTGSAVIADLRFAVDLGPALAKVSYQAAPSAT